ncbi:MAG: PstS family phosphate ABC transporter substrate-binding protein [Culicoidibacterales bacterium]
MKKFHTSISLLIGLLSLTLLSGCTAQSPSNLSGEVIIDGSSTIFPITEALAERYIKSSSEFKNVKIPISESGTGGGFNKFLIKETDVSNASRKMSTEEKEKAESNKLTYIEIKIGLDGITNAKHPSNTFVNSLTQEELKKIWIAGSTIRTWKDIRAEWPDRKINFYAPSSSNGTYDFFVESILGKGARIRSDYQANQSENILVQQIAGDENALGFLGYAYFHQNQSKLSPVGLISKGETQPVFPTEDTIKNNSYKPLSRPLFIYVNKDSYLNKPQVKSFIQFYIKHAKDQVVAASYIPLEDNAYNEILTQLPVS